MASERNQKFNKHFLRHAGTLSILAGILSLSAIFYMFFVLISLGFKLEYFDDTASLLAWVAEHPVYYAMLWLHQALAAVCMLGAPAAASSVYRRRGRQSSGWAHISQLLGLCGFFLIIIAALLFVSVSPVTAKFLNAGPQMAVVVQEAFTAFGVQMRLFGGLLVVTWLLMTGLFMLSQKKIDIFGWYSLALWVFTVPVVVGKSLGWYDWEPLLGIFLALTYIWFGRMLRVEAAK